MNSVSFRLLALSATLILTLACGSKPVPEETPAGVTIAWDAYGVPHISAPDFAGAFYAQGWAQAQNHGDVILQLYGEARTRGAEYWGKNKLQMDVFLTQMNVPARSQEWYAAMEADEKSWVDAFAKGFNAYAEKHPDKIGEDVAMVLPVDSLDVLNHLQRTMLFTFVARPDRIQNMVQGGQLGSNAWAVAPERSASGNALLLANPHLPWRGLFLFFESHMMVGDVNIYGTTLVGSPGITIGFNDYLGWTHTVNTHDGSDLYALELAVGGYKFDGQVKPFTEREHTLKIKGEDGSLSDFPLVVRESVHGPVLHEKDGKALALRVVGLDNAHLLDQYVQAAKATNLDQFNAAFSRLQMPMFTVMYADRDGRIMHLFGGEVPKRNGGDFAQWSGVAPGTSSENLWTEVHSYDELPMVVDPKSGWLQNANDPPWTTTFPLAIDPNDYPAYMAPRGMSFRPQSSARLMADDESITFDEFLAYRHDTRMMTAERLMDDLKTAVAQHGDARAKEALTVLTAWDGRADNDSTGAVLWSNFYYAMARDGKLWATPWSEDNPRETPDGFADPKKAADMLSSTADSMMERHGKLDIPWGEVHRFKRDDVNLPANGADGGLGVFRVMAFRADADGVRTPYHGDTFVAAIEFSTPPRAKVVLSYGNATQAGSPHRTDQLQLISDKKMRDALFTVEQVKAGTVRTETLTP